MRLSQMTQACNGILHGQDKTVERISIDTRSIQAGDVFVAIKGENFDGHDYICKALDAGAGAIVSSICKPEYHPCIEVEDTRFALGKMASAWLNQFSFKRVAVTGNAGKTTVKEMLACALGDGVLATEGNLNNDIGVPLTLFRSHEDVKFGVFELGANAPGEIAWTSSLVEADVSLITNVTGAHLEGFGSMQGIADAKSEIFIGAKESSIAIVNEDDRFADFFAQQAIDQGLKVVRVSKAKADADLYASNIAVGQQQVTFDVHVSGSVFAVDLPLSGEHQVSNALMALAAVRALDVDLEIAVERLKQIAPVKGRMNLLECQGGLLVDDSYNANPGSVKVAAQWLVNQPRPVVFVLGDLAELGPDAEDIMSDLGVALKEVGVEKLITVGDLAAKASIGFGENAIALQSHQQAAETVQRFLQQGGTVLVKGSRSAAMENVINLLTNSGVQG